MMKQNKVLRRTICVFAVLSLMVGSAVAASNMTKKTIEANYMGIKLVVDGVQVTPKDGSGNVVDPFISEGTTYLPVRAVGEALGKEVTWDGETKTVYIGQAPGKETNWMKELPPYKTRLADTYDDTDRSRSFSVAGVKHTAGVVLHSMWQNGAGNVGGFAIWNTNAQYKSVTFTIGSLDQNTANQTLKVDLDGSYLTEYELKWDAPPQTITVPLNYCANFRLYLNGSDSQRSYGIYDISFAE